VVRQLTPADAFVVGCRPGVENRPKEVGPDFDIGTSPILRSLPGGKRAGRRAEVGSCGVDPTPKEKCCGSTARARECSAASNGHGGDDSNVYVPVSTLAPPNEVAPHAVKLATNRRKGVEHACAEAECNTAAAAPAQSAPASVIPGVVFFDGRRSPARAGTTDGSIPGTSIGERHTS
jgi:hypothetical protein